MEVFQVVDESFPVNLYVARAKRAAVIDAGTGRFHDQVVKRVAAHADPRQIDAIVLTHLHADHSGGAVRLAQATRGATVYAGEADCIPLRAADSRLTGAALMGVRSVPVDVEPLKEGDEIDLGGASLRVLHTPGHTAGSLCLVDDAERSLFSGDTVFPYGSVGRWDLPSGDLGKLVASVDRLAGLRVKNLYAGHGPAVEGAAADHLAMASDYVANARVEGLR